MNSTQKHKSHKNAFYDPTVDMSAGDEPSSGDKEITPIDEDKAAHFLEKGGPLSSSPQFEERAGQLQLLRAIVRAFNTDSIGVFEAGTGIGKSYAYLIPAFLWAKTNNERVIISTGTINLQHQLFEKDIPAALDIVGLDVKAVLLKGRGNFVCLRRLADAEAQFLSKGDDLFDDKDGQELGEFKAIFEWAHSPDTVTGSKSELPFAPSRDVWNRVHSESESCLAGHCPFRPSCFVAKMRREARSAQIIVVNHHLLFADADSRLSGVSHDDEAVLPAFHRLIIDEAHDIEEAATSFFSDEVNRYSLGRPLSSLYRRQGRREKGYLLSISSAATEEAVQRIRDGADAARLAIAELERSASEAVPQGSIRLCQATEKKLNEVLKQAARTSEAVMAFITIAKDILSEATDEEKAVTKIGDGDKSIYRESAYWEAKLLVTRLQDAAIALSSFPEYDSEDGKKSVFYIEMRGTDHKYITFCRTPLDAAPKISRGIFEPLSTVICTSATLSVAGNMDYWLRQSGASLSEGERLVTASFPSPFPYQKNCLVAVPTDVPLPSDKDFGAYTAAAIRYLIKSSGGRALVLFTSFDALHQAASGAENAAHEMGIRILCQGDDDNARLLKDFKDDTTSVLFATHSFWQGIDVAGQSLSLVVIAKLPFTVPDDPVFEARSEAIEATGGNSFMQISVPQAVIRFRQGFGRLIRRSSDRGAVVILDSRVVSSRYGSIFMKSLPKTRLIKSELGRVIDTVDEFFRHLHEPLRMY